MENTTAPLEFLTVRELSEITGLYRSEIKTIMSKSKMKYEKQLPDRALLGTFKSAFRKILYDLKYGNDATKKNLHLWLEGIADYPRVIELLGIKD